MNPGGGKMNFRRFRVMGTLWSCVVRRAQERRSHQRPHLQWPHLQWPHLQWLHLQWPRQRQRFPSGQDAPNSLRLC